MSLARIAAARPLDGFRVQLTLTGGRVIERDLQPHLAGPILAKLQVHSGTLTWPNGAGLRPDSLIRGGPPPAGPISGAS